MQLGIAAARGLTRLMAVAAMAAATRAAPSLDVRLNATFSQVPYMAEIFESVAIESPKLAFELLREVDEAVVGATAGQMYDASIRALEQKDLGDKYGGPAMVDAVKLSLALHEAVPAVQFQYQHYVSQAPAAFAGIDCPHFVAYKGHAFCSEEQLLALTPALELPAADYMVNPRHVYFGRSAPIYDVASLYLDLSVPGYKGLLMQLLDMADMGLLTLGVSLKPPSNLEDLPRLAVPGFGVDLALKRTDYLVVDDRDSASTEAANLKQGLEKISNSQLKALGRKAAAKIMAAKSPIHELMRLSTRFPQRLTEIAEYSERGVVVDEIRGNQRKAVRAGRNFVWLNGLAIDTETTDPFKLIAKVREERQIVDSLVELGIPPNKAMDLLTSGSLNDMSERDEHVRFEFRELDLAADRPPVLMWLNDLTTDLRYQNWPNSIYAMLTPMQAGQYHRLRRNMHNLVLVIDISNPTHIQSIANEVNMLMKRAIPVRFGIVPQISSQSDDSILLAKLFYYLSYSYGSQAGLEFLILIAEHLNKGEKPIEFAPFIFEQVDKSHERPSIEEYEIAKEKEKHFDIVEQSEAGLNFESGSILPESEFSSMLGSMTYDQITKGPDMDAIILMAIVWARRLDIDDDAAVVIANGRIFEKTDSYMQHVGMTFTSDIPLYQQAIVEEKLAEDQDPLDVLLENAPSRRSHYVDPLDNVVKVINIQKVIRDCAFDYQNLPRILNDGTEFETFVIGDFDDPLVLETIRDLQKTFAQNGVSLIFVHNPDYTREPAYAARMVSLASKAKWGMGDVLTAVGEAESVTDQEYLAVASTWAGSAGFVKSLGLAPGEFALILNGRLIGPLKPSKRHLRPEHLEGVIKSLQQRYLEPIKESLDTLGIAFERRKDPFLARICSVVLDSQAPKRLHTYVTPDLRLRQRFYDQIDSTFSAIDLGSWVSARAQIVVVMDPISEFAQKWSIMLHELSKMKGVAIRIIMNPESVLLNVPLKRYYGMSFENTPQFDDEGNLITAKVHLGELPAETLLTMKLDVPKSWIIVQEEASRDLDNLRLDESMSSLGATYTLKHILVEGHAMDTFTNRPPAGSALILSDGEDHTVDTIVMANLGYFQFKAGPGLWILGLKDGRSSEIFEISKLTDYAHDTSVTKSPSGKYEVVVDSFVGTTVFPLMSRRVGQERTPILAPLDEQSVLLKQANKWIRKIADLVAPASPIGNSMTETGSQSAEINIFSIASGHLYERFIYIMVQSVMNHTKSSVKFWFIENYLSPSFRKFIPHMAAKYGFQYELITYHWPHWLRGQKEQQREIWGYKILFLDVIFPLDLDKVIFVDADQIVREDLKKLNDVDLEGAPYGYVPMCDSRKEIEGFRFWKKGFWETHLQGKPYHISALYVVDLRRFRQLAAGDILRQQYHALSADENSLANLDQDLPNYLQRFLPIYSLDQDWLWCETWCSDESLRTAKTIDLCNNPMTKEPKLERARRQIPEWVQYDDNAAALAKSIAANESQPALENIAKKVDNVDQNIAARHDEL